MFDRPRRGGPISVVLDLIGSLSFGAVAPRRCSVNCGDSHQTVGNGNMHRIFTPQSAQGREREVVCLKESRIPGNSTEPPPALVPTATLEGVMSLSTDRQIRNLPKRLPAGTVYVVEGRGDQHGKLRVSSRYVLMPSGQKVEIPMELGRTQPARVALRRSFAPKTRSVSRSKTISVPAKKFVLIPGTRSQKAR